MCSPKELLIEVLNAPKEFKPVIRHKAPPVFTWPENQAWDCMHRISHRLVIPTPDPWTNPEYTDIAESAFQPLSKKPKDAPSAFNGWIWTWAYEDPDKQGDDDRIPDKYPLGAFFTLLWMAGLETASRKHKVPVEQLFSDHDGSDRIRFLVKCIEVIDPRVRKAISHYGHILMVRGR